MHALYAGDTIVGSAIGTYGNGHYSQYINATAGGDIAKHRLIGLLAFEVFNDVSASGITTADFGLGDFDYKQDWTSPETVYDGVIPLTLRGSLAGSAILSFRRIKRAVKQHDQLWKLFRKLRAALGGRTAKAPQPE
jgi:CelD/BcsL family acetyltransferase involved in cellulose biosynthesis